MGFTDGTLPGVLSEKLPFPEHPDHRYSLVVRPSDLDMHAHVNNTKYIEWVTDSYPMEMHGSGCIAGLVIFFLAESSAGETVTIETGTDKGHPVPRFLHRAARESDGREIFRAEVIWNGNA